MSFVFRKFIWIFFCANVTQISANLLPAPLRISTRHFAPYMYQDSNGNFYKGMEFTFLQRMAEMLNVSLNFQASSNRSDICYDVAMNVSDICIGGIFPTEDILKHALISVTYTSDDLTWCVQKAGMMPVSFSQMHLIQPGAWLLIVFGYGYLSGFVLYLLVQFDLKYDQRNSFDWHHSTFLVLLPTVIGLSPNFQPVKGTVRIFFAFVLITSFFLFQIILTKAYDGYVYRQKPWHQIASFDEIMSEDFNLVGTWEAFNLLDRSEMIPARRIESFNVCEDATECLAYVSTLKNIAIGGSRKNMINSQPNSSSQIFCFDGLEHIATYPIALYMRHDFTLKKDVNEIVQQLIEAGFFVKWQSDNRIERKQESDIEPIPLGIANISAALVFFMGCGFVIATSVFVAENFVYWKKKQQRNNGHNVWIYLEEFFDGRRNYFKNVAERLEKQNKNFNKPFPYAD